MNDTNNVKRMPCPYPEHRGHEGECRNIKCPWWSVNVEINEGVSPNYDDEHCTIAEWGRM